MKTLIELTDEIRSFGGYGSDERWKLTCRWVKEACRQLGVNYRSSPKAWGYSFIDDLNRSIALRESWGGCLIADHLHFTSELLFMEPYMPITAFNPPLVDYIPTLVEVDCGESCTRQPITKSFYLVSLPTKFRYHYPQGENGTVYLLCKSLEVANRAIDLK